MGAGGGLPPAHHLLRDLRGHVQVNHQVRLRQLQQPVFRVEEPVQKGLPLSLRQLGRLVDGVGGGVAVRHHQTARFIKWTPVLLVRSVAVHGKHQGCRIGVHIAGMAAQMAVQILLDHSGRGLSVPGKVDVLIGNILPFQMLAQQPGLGGLAGTVGPLEYDQPSAHFRFPFSCRTWTRNSGSFIIRPMRFGSLQRR